jgi:mono/diheme cytochrome c family protein
MLTRLRLIIGLASCLVLTCAATGAGALESALVAEGHYLVHAGDCVSCHTAEGGAPFAGGFPVQTPFGVIYASNITPDRDTGIGQWSADEFYEAMHSGIAPGGRHLYPACPYPWFTKVSRADIAAIRAYLNSLPPIRQPNRAAELRWPLGDRDLMAVWNALFFNRGHYQPRVVKSTSWNRGAYLVEGLGHCSGCHGPKNSLGAVSTTQPFAGGTLETWFAPNLAEDARAGLGQWSSSEIAEYLRSGSTAHTAAAGPMAEVVANSTQYLSDSDLNAIATYLKDVGPYGEANGPAAESALSQSSARGAILFADNCTGCHMSDGAGQPDAFPRLSASSTVEASNAASVITVILNGARDAVTDSKPTGLAMPAFGWKFSDDEVADLANFIRTAWGNSAPRVEVRAVTDARVALIKSGKR